jgi:hypothetical protein
MQALTETDPQQPGERSPLRVTQRTRATQQLDRSIREHTMSRQQLWVLVSHPNLIPQTGRKP